MKKQFKSIYVSLFLIVACNISSQKTVKMDFKEIPEENRVLYAISLSVQHPFELYINDIKAKTENESGSMKVDVNDWVLKNGKYPVKMKLYHKDVPEDVLEYTRVELVKYTEYSNEHKAANSRKVLKKLPVVYTKEGYTEITWEIELTELPYELKGWEDSRVFTEKDRDWLEPKVIAYYEKIRKVLNKGDVNGFFELRKKARQEAVVCLYITPEEHATYVKNKTAKLKRAEGNMLPIEDYTLQLYAGGRVMALERKATTEFQGYDDFNIKGWSPLIRKFNKALRSNPIMIHMPSKKKASLAGDVEWGDFEIIR